MKKILIIAFFLEVNCCADNTLINFEDYIGDIVENTQRIILKEYPFAFNPSIVRIKDKILLSFRVIPERKNRFCSYIGLVWLNKSLEPISKPQLLKLRKSNCTAPSRCEDGRLLFVNDHLYLIYSDNEDVVISKGGFRMYVAEIDYMSDTFQIKKVEKLAEFEDNDEHRREKNWVPFEYKNKLLLSYSLEPHKVLLPVLEKGVCKSVALTNHKLEWDFGELRGGTTALRNNDHYLAFFHSFKRMYTVHAPGKNAKCYCMGAYLFSAKPPFRITHMSPVPLVGKKFYQGSQYVPYWGTVVAIFPCGFIFQDEKILVAYGRQDHEMWIATLDKKKLYASLVPVID